MIKYVKKEDQFCKYYIRYNVETKDATTVYRNLDGKRYGINLFKCFPLIYEGSDYTVSTQEEFETKLEIIKGLIR